MISLNSRPILQDRLLHLEYHLDMGAHRWAEKRSLLQGFGRRSSTSLERLLEADLECGLLSLLQKRSSSQGCLGRPCEVMCVPQPQRPPVYILPIVRLIDNGGQVPGNPKLTLVKAATSEAWWLPAATSRTEAERVKEPPGPPCLPPPAAAAEWRESQWPCGPPGPAPA